jgi:hypothetical protein
MTTARLLFALVAAACLLAGPAGAAAPATGTAATPATRRTVPPAPAAVRKAGRTTSVTHPHAPADTSVRTRPRVAPRTLDDIHIEGEIPVPQVLFITAREQRRLMEFQHHRYQRTSLELGRATATPARIVVTSPTPAERKEMQR